MALKNTTKMGKVCEQTVQNKTYAKEIPRSAFDKWEKGDQFNNVRLFSLIFIYITNFHEKLGDENLFVFLDTHISMKIFLKMYEIPPKHIFNRGAIIHEEVHYFLSVSSQNLKFSSFGKMCLFSHHGHVLWLWWLFRGHNRRCFLSRCVMYGSWSR